MRRDGRRILVWVAFAGLCLLLSADWLIPPSFGTSPPGIELEGIAWLILALGAIVFARRKDRPGWYVIFGLLAFFAVPAILLSESAEGASPTGIAVVFALVPVVVAMFLGGTGQRVLAPVLAGVCGLLFVIPVTLPSGVRGWGAYALALGAAMVVGGVGARLPRLLYGLKMPALLVVAGLANAGALLGWTFLRGSGTWHVRELGWIAAVRLALLAVELMLTLWLLREMDPVRFSARFLWVPLLTILEGAVFLRPPLTMRLATGTLLLMGGAVILLRMDWEGDEQVVSLR